MNQVHVARVAREGEIVAVRKQRIERAERVVSGLVITRRGIDLEPQTRRPGHVGDGVPTAAAHGPGADAFAADVTSLAHCFEVPVEAAARAGVSDIEVVAALVAARVEKGSLVENEALIVRRQVTRADVLTLDPHASILEMLAGEVVEEMLVAILNRHAPESNRAPLALLPVQPRGVVGLPDVRTVAHRDEALEIERHLLPSHPGLQRAAPERIDVGDEGQAEIQRVLVDRRDDVFRRRADVLELDEELPVRIRPNVDVPLETVQEVTVASVTRDPEQRRVVQLEALAHGETEGYVAHRIVERKRDVFQAVERLGSQVWVGQRRPVFQPTIKRIDLGASCVVLVSRRRARARRCYEEADDGQKTDAESHHQLRSVAWISAM